MTTTPTSGAADLPDAMHMAELLENPINVVCQKTAAAVLRHQHSELERLHALAAAQGDAIEHELAMLIRRIVSSARRNCQDESNVLKLANEAWAYLVRKGLVGSPLRDAGIESDVAPSPPPRHRQTTKRRTHYELTQQTQLPNSRTD